MLALGIQRQGRDIRRRRPAYRSDGTATTPQDRRLNGYSPVMAPAPPTPGPEINLTQVSLLVRDVEATMRAYHAAFGWGPWAIYELRAPVLHDVKVLGAPAQCDMLAAIAPAGGVDIEVFQPLSPGPLADLLEHRGEGLHHICCRRADGADADLDASLRGLSGTAPVVEGTVGTNLTFSYIDLQDSLKAVVETLAGAVETTGEPDRIWPSSS